MINGLTLIALAAKATPAQAGTTAIIFIGCCAVIFFAYHWVYKQLSKKIAKIKSSAKKQQTFYTPEMQNELDYADYITWAAKNGYGVHYNKKTYIN